MFMAVNEAISPEPEDAKPMEGVSFVQSKVVPGAAPVKITAVVKAPLQTTWLETGSTVGIGFTITLKNVGDTAVHPLRST